METIKEKFEKLGYKVKTEPDKFEILSPYLWCDSKYAYGVGDRDQTVVAFGLQSLEKNILGLYFFATSKAGLVMNELYPVSKEIFAGASTERIQDIFLQYLGSDFITYRINFDPGIARPNAFNYVRDGESHRFHYLAEEKYITVASSSNINFSYRRLLIAACLRKQYEEILSNEFSDLMIDEELDLSLYSIFYSNTYSIIEQLQGGQFS